MHNASVYISNRIPYQVLLGRQQHFVPPLGGGYHRNLNVNGQDNLARVREIAAVAIIEFIAKQRSVRNDNQVLVPVIDRSDQQAGDFVDAWYDPP